MPIVSSEKFEDAHFQRDGSKWVGELHTDHTGKKYRYTYRWREGIDRDATMSARKAAIEARLPEDECDAVLEIDAAPVLNHQTGAQFLARLRERYRDASPERVVRIARWIKRRIAAGDVTATQLRNAFGLTPSQWDALKAKIDALADSLDAVETAKGE